MRNDDDSIIYVALCNSCQCYISSLENEILEDGEEDMIKYLIKRHYEILDKYELILGKENTIGRPTWGDQ